MKHIAIDARIINSSTGRYIERLLHYLQEVDKTNRYTVLVRAKDRNYWKPTSKNFSVKIANFTNYSFGEQIGFKKFLDQLQPDLVHFCMPQQPVLYKGVHVTTIHDLTLLRVYNSDKNWLIYHIKQLIGKMVFRRVVRTSKYIITISEFSKKDILKTYNLLPNKVRVTYLSADINNKNTKPYKHPFKKFIMYVGQQSDYKNIRRLGDAHQKLLEQHPGLGLILVGKINASARINQDYFNKNNYRNIHFTDFIPDDQLGWLYSHTSAYIFPSLMEGFGLPGLEAMGYGAPVVSSSATCLPEVYGDAAIYFDPLDVGDMVDKINQVLSNNKLRSGLIKKGYKQIKKYSWQQMAEQTHKVYMDSLISK